MVPTFEGNPELAPMWAGESCTVVKSRRRFGYLDAASSAMRVRIGECVFDSEARELTRAGSTVPLSPKALQLLTLLLERRPSAVSKTALHDSIWPGTFVAYTSLPRVVTELRHALGDRSRRPRFVRTVHGFGYAFSGQDVQEVPEVAPGSPSRFSLLWDRRRIVLTEGETLIGRGADCDVRIDSDLVSRHHARIRVAAGKATLEDCHSKNGSYVRGTRVKTAVTLEDGDDIKMGRAILVFHAGDRDAYGSTATEDIDV
jgi:DNA-binding winged helix-turn-helix (wHTH) protein